MTLPENCKKYFEEEALQEEASLGFFDNPEENKGALAAHHRISLESLLELRIIC